jgi:hypothetical protein
MSFDFYLKGPRQYDLLFLIIIKKKKNFVGQMAMSIFILVKNETNKRNKYTENGFYKG